MLGIRVKATEARANAAISTGLLSRGTAEKFTPKKEKASRPLLAEAERLNHAQP